MNERTTILLRLSENNRLLHTTFTSPSGESLFESLSRCWSLIVMISLKYLCLEPILCALTLKMCYQIIDSLNLLGCNIFFYHYTKKKKEFPGKSMAYDSNKLLTCLQIKISIYAGLYLPALLTTNPTAIPTLVNSG